MTKAKELLKQTKEAMELKARAQRAAMDTVPDPQEDTDPNQQAKSMLDEIARQSERKP